MLRALFWFIWGIICRVQAWLAVRFGPRVAASRPRNPIRILARGKDQWAAARQGVIDNISAWARQAEELRLRFRMRGEKDYLSTPMRKLPQQGWWEGAIPGWIVTPKGVEYYLSGQQGGQTITVPPEPHRKPFGVRVH